jgi:hypothetical protein
VTENAVVLIQAVGTDLGQAEPGDVVCRRAYDVLPTGRDPSFVFGKS